MAKHRKNATDTDPSDPVRARLAAAIELHRPKLVIIASAVLGQRDGAEDIVQEAARVALEKPRALEEVENLPAWLAQVVRNVALNARRANQRRPSPRPSELLDAQGSSPSAPPNPVTSAGQVLPDQSSFDDRVMAALHDLDDRARACLLLRVILGLPYKQIAETLAIPEGTAMSHVLRSRRAMAKKLAEQESHD